MNKFDVEKLVLHVNNGYDLKIKKDEFNSDPALAVLYNLHGDDRLIIRDNKGQYHEYTYFEDLRYFSEDDMDVKSELFFKPDTFSELSNHLNWKKEELEDRFTYRIKEYRSREYSQYIFKSFIDELRMCKKSGVIYNANRYYDTLNRFLVVNSIDTDNNIAILNRAKTEEHIFDSKVDGIDGYAGRWDNCWPGMIADSIKAVWYKGKEFDKDKISTKHYRDEWGCDMADIKLEQFA